MKPLSYVSSFDACRVCRLCKIRYLLEEPEKLAENLSEFVDDAKDALLKHDLKHKHVINIAIQLLIPNEADKFVCTSDNITEDQRQQLLSSLLEAEAAQIQQACVPASVRVHCLCSLAVTFTPAHSRVFTQSWFSILQKGSHSCRCCCIVDRWEQSWRPDSVEVLFAVSANESPPIWPSHADDSGNGESEKERSAK